MPFKFLKYLQPTHYFRLKNHSGQSVFPKVDELPNAIKFKLNLDTSISFQKLKHTIYLGRRYKVVILETPTHINNLSHFH